VSSSKGLQKRRVPNDDGRVKDKPRKKHGEPRAHLAKIKEGSKELYVAVVREHVRKIENASTIRKIEKLIKIREKAAKELAEIIQDTGISGASIHKVSVVSEED
jgi:hypothetical protein